MAHTVGKCSFAAVVYVRTMGIIDNGSVGRSAEVSLDRSVCHKIIISRSFGKAITPTTPQPTHDEKQQLNNHTARTLEESGWAVRQPWPHCASGPLASEAGHETATTTTLRQAAARRLKLGTIVDARQLHKWTSLKLDAKAAGGWCGGRRGGLVVVATAAVVGDRIGCMVGGQWMGRRLWGRASYMGEEEAAAGWWESGDGGCVVGGGGGVLAKWVSG